MQDTRTQAGTQTPPDENPSQDFVNDVGTTLVAVTVVLFLVYFFLRRKLKR